MWANTNCHIIMLFSNPHSSAETWQIHMKDFILQQQKQEILWRDYILIVVC